MLLYADPPCGWVYGFPKPYTRQPSETMGDWLIANGYPSRMVRAGMDKYVRIINAQTHAEWINRNVNASTTTTPQ